MAPGELCIVGGPIVKLPDTYNSRSSLRSEHLYINLLTFLVRPSMEHANLSNIERARSRTRCREALSAHICKA